MDEDATSELCSVIKWGGNGIFGPVPVKHFAEKDIRMEIGRLRRMSRFGNRFGVGEISEAILVPIKV